MGLFDSFKKNGKQKTQTNKTQLEFGASSESKSDNNPADNESQAMRTVYALSKYVGSVAMFTGTRVHEESSMPNFFEYCYWIQSMLPQQILDLCEYEGLSISELYLSPRFKNYLDPSYDDMNTYLSNCGIIAYEETYERSGRNITFVDGKINLSLNLMIQLQTMLDTSKMAFVQCLLLLRETRDESLKDWLQHGLIYNVLRSSLMLQMNLFHMQNQRGLVFIPDSDMNTSEQSFNLSFLDPISPNKRLFTYPMVLNLAFIQNEDGTVLTGEVEIAGRKGTIYTTTDEAMPYINGIANNFSNGL